MPLNWGPRSGNGEQREEHELNQKFVSLIIRCAKRSVLSLKTHTQSLTHLHRHSHTQPHSLIDIPIPLHGPQGRESPALSRPLAIFCSLPPVLDSLIISLLATCGDEGMLALRPHICCCYLHPDRLSGFCLSSIGPVKGSRLVGIRAQAGDPLAWHLSMGQAEGGQALELGRGPGLAWASRAPCW